jgi:hypothetical protein
LESLFEPEKDSALSSQKSSLVPDLVGILVVVSALAAYFWSGFRAPNQESGRSIHPQDTPTPEGEL